MKKVKKLTLAEQNINIINNYLAQLLIVKDYHILSLKKEQGIIKSLRRLGYRGKL